MFDHASPIGELIVAAPSYFRVEAEFHGRAAHAGIRPEDGRSAIVAAANALDRMELGRLDPETTANAGRIEGGTAANVVPERCRVELEARSVDPDKANRVVERMVDALTDAASDAECDVETHIEEQFRAYRMSRTAPLVETAAAALTALGIEPEYVTTGGGSDANVFNAAGPALPERRERHRPQPRTRRVRHRRGARERARRGAHTGRMQRLALRRGTVVAVDGAELTVDVDGEERPAVAYEELTGPNEVGDEVVVNVAARDLALGSGGFDIVHVNLTRGLAGTGIEDAHVMKLNYTPLQHAIDPVEAEELDLPVEKPVAVLLPPRPAPVRRLGRARARADRLRTDGRRRASGVASRVWSVSCSTAASWPATSPRGPPSAASTTRSRRSERSTRGSPSSGGCRDRGPRAGNPRLGDGAGARRD